MDLFGIVAALFEGVLDLAPFLSDTWLVRLLGVATVLTGLGVWLVIDRGLVGGLLLGLGLFLLLTAQLRAWDR
jgi:hypothetical protein